MEDTEPFVMPVTARRDLIAVVAMHLFAFAGAYYSPMTWHGLGYMLFMAIMTGMCLAYASMARCGQTGVLAPERPRVL